MEMTIRRVMNNVLNRLRYPASVENFIKGETTTLTNFINELQIENVISENDKHNINTISDTNAKKLAIGNLLNLKINNFRIFGTIKNSKHTIFVCLEKNNKIKAFTLKLKNYFYIFLHIFTYFYKICKVRFKGILNYINGLLCLL